VRDKAHAAGVVLMAWVVQALRKWLAHRGLPGRSLPEYTAPQQLGNHTTSENGFWTSIVLDVRMVI
jgi:hypothetical protein